MGTAIRTQIIKIAHSQGVRIPKLLLEQSGIHAEVKIEVLGITCVKAVETTLSKLPMIAKGLLTCDVIALKPYVGLASLFTQA